MNSWATVEEARKAATDEAVAIIQIDPGPGINSYIVAKCRIATLRTALARKPMREIRRLVAEVVDLQAERWAAREAKIQAAVPGLEELRAAREDENRYHEQFERMMEDEGNDGARPPRPVKVASRDVAAQLPIAAAYLKAEGWEHASNYAKSAAGRKAKERIEAGEEHAVVIAEMEAEWSNHVDEHAWD